MQREPRTVSMKDGRSCVLRPVREEDAAELLETMQQITKETPYLCRTTEEWAVYSLEGEQAFLKAAAASDSLLMLVAEVDGHIVGDCEIRFMTGAKTRHRATIGIALLKSCWGQGIGTAIFEELLDAARERDGVRQVELGVLEGNARARGLYEKMGFRLTGIQPDAVLQADGSLKDEYMMMRKL